MILLDEQDKHYLEQGKWSKNSDGYAVRDNKYLHRLVMSAKQGDIIDHINGNRLDNRRSNLRKCTRQQNNMNRGKQKNNTSGYKGVYWQKNLKKWLAQIQLNRKSIYLGYYKCKHKAAMVRFTKELELFKEFTKKDM